MSEESEINIEFYSIEGGGDDKKITPIVPYPLPGSPEIIVPKPSPEPQFGGSGNSHERAGEYEKLYHKYKAKYLYLQQLINEK